MHDHAHAFGGAPDSLRSPQHVARLELDRVAALTLEDIAPRSVLDIGTGTGLAAETFAARGLRATGVDASESMLAAAHALLPGCDFARTCMERLPFRDAAFDLTFLGRVLHETGDVEQALSEALRVTRLRTAILEWPYAEPGPEGGGPPLSVRLSPDAVVHAARSAGYAGVVVTPLTYMVLYRLDVKRA